MAVRRAAGKTSTFVIAATGSVSAARAESEDEESWLCVNSTERELFSDKRKQHSEDEVSQPGSPLRSRSRQSPQTSPSPSPDSLILATPLENLVPAKSQLIKNTWKYAEKMASNPSIREAIEGSSEFQEFVNFMDSFPEPEGEQSERIPVEVEVKDSSVEPEPEEGLQILDFLSSIIQKPVGWLRTALEWILCSEDLEGKQNESSKTFTILTGLIILIIAARKFRNMK